ncbi:MAG: 16S rRNA (guanine(966)-N(2))-methyltransferase RsmD [Kangiellaceae bacterium]|nr:16S rRNA (guanine(966)-N(2))-methyltransferase RsmD [Kangiellaceae bacterium]
MKQSKSDQRKNSPNQEGSVRIIGGKMRGRKITFSNGEGLRPTLDRIRETAFNWLASHIVQSNCLDLFAGSGAFGIEAISRGASSIVLVDSSLKATKGLKKNINLLSIDNSSVINQTAEDFLKNNLLKFDLVFLDPPYDKGLLQSTLEKTIPHLFPNALVYVEQEAAQKEPEYPDHWQVIKSKKTSRFYYQLLKLK